MRWRVELVCSCAARVKRHYYERTYKYEYSVTPEHAVLKRMKTIHKQHRAEG